MDREENLWRRSCPVHWIANGCLPSAISGTIALIRNITVETRGAIAGTAAADHVDLQTPGPLFVTVSNPAGCGRYHASSAEYFPTSQTLASSRLEFSCSRVLFRMGGSARIESCAPVNPPSRTLDREARSPLGAWAPSGPPTTIRTSALLKTKGKNRKIKLKTNLAHQRNKPRIEPNRTRI